MVKDLLTSQWFWKRKLEGITDDWRHNKTQATRANINILPEKPESSIVDTTYLPIGYLLNKLQGLRRREG